MAIRESFLSELLATFFGEFGGKMLQETIKGEIKSGAGFFGNHLNNLIKQNPRAQLLSVLLRLEPEDMEKFWKHHSEAMEGRIPTWSENSLTVVLGNALPRKADGTVDMTSAKETMKQLLAMDETEFHQTLEVLRHDPIAQQIRLAIRCNQAFAEAVIIRLAEYWGYADEKATQLAQKLNTRDQFPSRPGRLAKFSSWRKRVGWLIIDNVVK
jgi:hypothetical protein